jgi:hypothetical protein
MNVLHQFAGAAELISKLKDLLADGGQLYLTSLVLNGRYIGDHWLGTLHKSGEFVRPRSAVELNKLLDGSLGKEVTYRMKGNMAFATTAAYFDPHGA